MPLRRFNSVLHKAITAVIFCCAALYSSLASANTFNVFGKTYVRQTGAPVTVSDRFSVFNPDTQYTLHVQNSGVSSAVISVNGIQILGPSDFNPNVTEIDRTLNLQVSNEIDVQLRSKPGSSLTISIIGIDNEPPVITASATPKANAFGWNNTNVVVTFTCSDRISGVASCPSPVTVSSEGGNQVISGTAVDRAGNTASTSVTVNIDKTPPTIAAVASPQANAAGWNNTPVAVSFTCSDSLSGIATCPAPVQVTTQGANQVITGTATDKAGNQASTAVKLSIDTTPPVISATASPPPNPNGWNNSDVTITFHCFDDDSGIAICPPPQILNKEQANQVVVGSATDVAGNSATASITVSIDKTPPLITASASPQPNAAGWNNTDVTVTFQCSDAGSGIANCPAAQIVRTEGADQVITGTATDIAGNTSAASITLKIAKTPPSISASASPLANAAGWNNTDVNVTFQCVSSASGAPIASCPAPVTVSTEGAHQLITGTVTDVAGNTAQATVTLNVDKTPPVISASASPAANAAGWNNTDVVVTFACTDSLSGIANCPSPITLSTEGAALSANGTATDIAGNTAQASVTVKIDKTPPVVSISSPAPGTIVRNPQSPVTASASDALSGIASVNCNGAPAAVSANGNINCTATLSTGANTISITATDIAGNTSSSQVGVTFELPPVANPGPGYSGTPGTPIAFSAAASTDPDTGPVTFAWDFGDGSTGSGVTVMHTYSQAGTYTVTLVVSDSHNGLAKATTIATIVQPDLPPTVNANGPYSGVTGTPIAFSGSGTDPVGNALTFTWAFGDGTFGNGTSTSHTYSSPGTYTATLTASDGQLSATSSALVKVAQANRPPTVSAGGPYSGVTGSAVSFTATGSDPDGDPVTFTWDFGDAGTGSGANVSHTFATPGNYTVKVTGNDGRGGLTTASSTAAIAQAPRPPHANPGGPYTGQAKTRILFNGSGSSSPDNVSLTYTWDFGDGNTGTGVAPNHGYAVAGNYTVSLTVDDGRGLKDSAATSVAVTPATTAANQPPVANPGGPYSGEAGQVVSFNGSGSSDPDGDTLAYKWDFGDGNTANTVAPTHIYLAAGTYSVSLAVDDGNGNVISATTSAVIAPPADHIPPHITLSAPAKVLPGSSVTVTASATDNVGVVSVTFDVDGAQSSTVTAPPYQRIVSAPSVSAPGAVINVRATAADAAGNTATAQASIAIDATPQTETPTVTINAPASAAPGSIIVLTATASDSGGIASVAFSSNGSQVATVLTAPYESTYTVPADAAVGSTIQFSVRATNFSGNYTDATAIVNIVQQVTNTNAPTVSISAPANVTSGSVLSISATATGASGVSSVSFYVEGELIGTALQPPYSAAFNVPATAAPGTILHIEVHADDFNGDEGRATAQTMIAAAQNGIVIGQVLDDSTGLLLPGASVALIGNDSTGSAYTQTAQTDARGRFELHAPAGLGTLVVTNNGMTRVDRLVNLQSSITTKALDARLTPLAAAADTISGVLGGTVSSSAGSLSIPAGAASGSPGFTLTAISQQGIEGTLPPGWSPVSSIDISPHSTSLSGAQLSVPNALLYAAGTALLVAKWDESASAWRAAGAAVVSQDGSTIQGPIDGSGQYSILAADTLPSSPVSPNPGEILTGVTNSLVPPDAMSLVIPKPKVIIYAPGVNSDVAGSFTSSLPLPSGTIVSSVITESYQFFSGAQTNPEPFTIDLVTYQTSTDGTQQSAIYKVSPSLTFEPLTLQSGVIDVQLLAPTSAPAPISTIGSNGGTLTAPTQETVTLPPNAVPQAIPLQITGLSASDLGITIQQGVDFLGAMRLDFVGTLTLPAKVSIPTPASLGDTTGIFLVRLQELQGQTRMVLVGIGDVDGNNINSDVILPGAQKTFEGVKAPGRYAFVHMQALTGFSYGTVFGTDGKPFLGAMVSSSTVPIVSLSRGTDGYIAIGVVGAASFTAQDLMRSGLASGSVTFATENDVQALDLHLVEQPPTVVSIIPSNGTTSVGLDSAIVVTFSQAIDPNSVTGTKALNIALTAAGGTVVATSVSLSSGNTVVTLRPNASLQPNTAYTLTLATGIANLSGDQLAAPATATFTSLDTRAPPPPPAGSITATIPTLGQTTVTATQGTAGLHDTVTIINFTTGQVTPVLVQPDGSFSTNVAASVTDKLQIKISNGSGNDTTINLPRYSQTNSDGSTSYAMDSTGGHIDGPGGTAIDVSPATFPDGTVVTMQAVAEADFPVQLTDQQKTVFTYAGGLRLDFGGVTPQKYVNISVPAQPGDKPGDQWIVSAATQIGDQMQLNVVDTARLFGHRIGTSSPPCPGATGAAVYGIYKSKQSYGLNYGQISSTFFGGVYLVLSDVSVLGFQIPFTSFTQSIGNSFCLPVLSGNVSIDDNHQFVTIPAQQLAPSDRQVIVTSTDSDGNPITSTFPINGIYYNFEVPGTIEDSFTVTAVSSLSPVAPYTVPSIRVETASDTTVLVSFSSDLISIPQIKEIDVQNTRTTVTSPFPQTNNAFKLSVPGGLGSILDVQIISADGTIDDLGGEPQSSNSATLASQFTVTSPTGPEPLIAHAVPGTVDPTWDQLNGTSSCPIYPGSGHIPQGQGVVDVTISESGKVNQVIHVPPEQRCNGGFSIGIPGGHLSDSFAITEIYSNQPATAADCNNSNSQIVCTPYSFPIPTFTVNVVHPASGEVVQSFVERAPGASNSLFLGNISDDHTPPEVVGTPADPSFYDPGTPITFTFSKPIDSSTFPSNAVVDSAGNIVSGHWVMSDGNEVATFIPTQPLQLGSSYSISLKGVKDSSGIALPPTMASYRITTFVPRLVSHFRTAEDSCAPSPTTNCPTPPDMQFDKVAFRRKVQSDGTSKTTLVASTLSRDGSKLMTIDVTSPGSPTLIAGSGFGGDNYTEGLGLVADVGKNGNPPLQLRQSSPCPSASSGVFSGDLAITTAFRPVFIGSESGNVSYINFWDVTNPQQICELGGKVLTTDQAFTEFDFVNGTVQAAGYARAVGTLPTSNDLEAYIAVGQVGAMAVSVGQNSPVQSDASLRKIEGLYSADYRDLTVFNNDIIAVDESSNELDVLDPNLTLLSSLSLLGMPRSVATVAALATDDNNDGQTTLHDIALIGADDTDPPPGVIQSKLQVVDISNLQSPQLLGSVTIPGLVRQIVVDHDKRRAYVASYYGNQALQAIDLSHLTHPGLLWSAPPSPALQPNGIAIDTNRGLLYVAGATGIDIWAINDICCDLIVDMAPNPASSDDPDCTGANCKDNLVRREKAALQTGIYLGLNAAANACADQGGTNGISILEQGSGACIFQPDDPNAGPQEPKTACARNPNYQPGVSDHDFEVFLPGPGPVNRCVSQQLTNQFKDPETGGRIPIHLNDGSTVVFDDITFFPVLKSQFENAQLDLSLPPPGGDDPVGDGGLGRQQLLLKWLLEGDYVDLNNFMPGSGSSVPTYQLSGKDLSAILVTLASNIGDPSKDSPALPFAEGYEWSILQDYAFASSKAFVRIRGASDESTSLHKLYVKQLHSAGKAGIRTALARMVADPGARREILNNLSRSDYNTNGCLSVDPQNNDPNSWIPKNCGSFEEWVASVAAKTVRSFPGHPALPLFSVADVQLINRFFRVKADQEHIEDEATADDFLTQIFKFITTARLVTVAAFPGPYQAATRQTNVTEIDGRRIALRKQTKIPLVPHVANRGFVPAQEVPVSIWLDANKYIPPPDDGTKTTVPDSLMGGDDHWLDYQHAPAGGLLLDGQQKAIPVFQLTVDTTLPTGPHAVSFTIDLEDSGHKVKEAFRLDNFTGFYYYLLGETPPGSTIPPPPVPPDRLTGDAECTSAPLVKIVQQILVDGTPFPDQATIPYGKAVTIREIVTNLTIAPVLGLQVCNGFNPGQCQTTNINPRDTVNVDFPFTAPSDSEILDGFATAKADSVAEVDGPTSRIITAQAIFKIAFFDATPLSDPIHPFSRSGRSRDTNGDPAQILGAVTDGTANAVRIAVGGLQPNTATKITLIDPIFPNLSDGLGQLSPTQMQGSNQTPVVTISVSADLQGNAFAYYTPPSFFVRPSVQSSDWNQKTRAVNVVVQQDQIGTTEKTLILKRPPVFLVHGLFGTIDVFNSFQPLVPTQTAALYSVPRPGFDGRFDVFNVGTDTSTAPLKDEVDQVTQQIYRSLNGYQNGGTFYPYLQGYAVGKIDVIAHSMGGLVMRKMTNENPLIAAAIRKLIVINSPLRGTPLADQIVQKRNASLLSVTDDSCTFLINIYGIFKSLSGAVDDLQTTSQEVQQIRLKGSSVPTHHIVTSTQPGLLDARDYDFDPAHPTDLGPPNEVAVLWAALGAVCNWTPDTTTVQATKDLRNSPDKTLQLIAAFAGGTGGVAQGFATVLGNAVALKDFVADGIFGSSTVDPTLVFIEPTNDRVVPLSSQLEGLTLADQSVTEVSNYSDHQETKISSSLPNSACIVSDQAGVPGFSAAVAGNISYDAVQPFNPFIDLLRKPPVACHVMNLLELDPKGTYFKQP